MENLTETMEKIGLSRKEALVYLALLRIGQASASLVAKNSGLKRPTTYLILEELRKRGLVLKTPGDKRQMFVAKSPEDALNEAKRNVDKAFRALPQLMGMFAKGEQKVRTIHFEGLKGVREALWYRFDELKGTEITAFFGDSGEASEELNALFHSWNKALFDNGIKLRSVVPDSPGIGNFRKTDKEYGFSPKVLPQEEYASKTSIDITDRFVRIIMFKEQQAVVIENRAVAKAMKEIFQMVWSKA